MEIKQFTDLLGKTLIDIEINNSKDTIILTTNDNKKYKLYHDQDCCESVNIEDINGCLTDLLNVPLLQAEEVISDEHNGVKSDPDNCESLTFTFYKFATIKGYVTIRWCGSSNGYYSESVDFIQITTK